MEIALIRKQMINAIGLNVHLNGVHSLLQKKINRDTQERGYSVIDLLRSSN